MCPSVLLISFTRSAFYAHFSSCFCCCCCCCIYHNTVHCLVLLRVGAVAVGSRVAPLPLVCCLMQQQSVVNGLWWWTCARATITFSIFNSKPNSVHKHSKKQTKCVLWRSNERSITIFLPLKMDVLKKISMAQHEQWTHTHQRWKKCELIANQHTENKENIVVMDRLMDTLNQH